MDLEALLGHIEEALRAVKHPRFYESERGFQGSFLSQLQKLIPDKLLPPGAVIEQEYQKRLDHHGLRIRPDIIIHEPFDPSRFANPYEGNIAVVEMKLNASIRDATGDFDNLVRIMDVLAYPLGVFINIASQATHANVIPESSKGRIVSFATLLRDDGIHIVRSVG